MTQNFFVPKFYNMDPETDDLLLNGRHLANGMKVLIDSSNQRVNVEAPLNDWLEDRAVEINRWCVIGALEIVGDDVHFIGVYEDGSKRSRTYSVSQSWLVKKDSIRDSANMTTDRYKSVLKLVSRAMQTVTETARDESLSDRAKALRVGRKVEDTTKQILGIL